MHIDGFVRGKGRFIVTEAWVAENDAFPTPQPPGRDRVVIDPSVVRGLEYYTGPVFEVESLLKYKDEKGKERNVGSICGGGRYDGLMEELYRSISGPPGGQDFELFVAVRVAVVGGPSGTGLLEPTALQDLAHSLGIADVVRFETPTRSGQGGRDRLRDWYAAADALLYLPVLSGFGLPVLAVIDAQALRDDINAKKMIFVAANGNITYDPFTRTLIDLSPRQSDLTLGRWIDGWRADPDAVDDQSLRNLGTGVGCRPGGGLHVRRRAAESISSGPVRFQ